MNIEVGMYVRIVTLSGHGSIGRLQKIDNICVTDNGAVDKNNIRKFSYNIIDLIEEGDYVNGHIVEDLDDLGYITLDDDTIKYDDIKSIVTKEQFESMKYEVSNE